MDFLLSTPPNPNIVYVYWIDESMGKSRNLIDDDGEITEAPERILITSEFLEFAPSEMMARDGNLVMIRGKTTMVCYELLEESLAKLSWDAKLVKKEGF